MLQKLFYDFESGAITEMSSVEAQQLETSGKGLIVDMPKAQETSTQIKQKVDAFKKRINEITTSDDPVYKVEGAQEYYTAQARAKLEAEIEPLIAEWRQAAETYKHAVYEDVARSRRHVSDADREAGRQHSTRVVNACRYGNGQAALTELAGLVPYMTDGQRTVLLDELDRIESAAAGKYSREIKALYKALTLNDGGAMSMRIADAISSRSVDTPYRQLRLTHRAYADVTGNQHNERKFASVRGY